MLDILINWTCYEAIGCGYYIGCLLVWHYSLPANLWVRIPYNLGSSFATLTTAIFSNKSLIQPLTYLDRVRTDTNSLNAEIVPVIQSLNVICISTCGIYFYFKYGCRVSQFQSYLYFRSTTPKWRFQPISFFGSIRIPDEILRNQEVWSVIIPGEPSRKKWR